MYASPTQNSKLKTQNCSEGFLSREIKAFGFLADGEIKIDIGPEIFIDHHPYAKSNSRPDILE
jgi:hypothetical protein